MSDAALVKIVYLKDFCGKKSGHEALVPYSEELEELENAGDIKIKKKKTCALRQNSVNQTETTSLPSDTKTIAEENNELIKQEVQRQKTEVLEKKPVLDAIKINNVKEGIEASLKAKDKSTVTEYLSQCFLDTNYIYTIRDDERPELWIYKEGIYIPQGKTYIREFCDEMLGVSYGSNLVSEVISKIEAKTYIEQDQFFKNEDLNLIAIENGILDIHTKELSEFTPERIFFSKLPVVYDSEKDCPTIKKHLKTVLKTKDDVPVMQELFGYLLYRDYKIEKAIMCNGDGRNGKGKTLELMKRFIGVHNVANVGLEELERPDGFATSRLHNKMANLCPDLSPTALKKTGMFKSLTGHDHQEANRKFKDAIPFTNYAKMIYSCNVMPKSYDLTNAFFDRWVYLEFPYRFVSAKEIEKIPEKEREFVKLADSEIINKLSNSEELSGLLNWALIGLERLLKQGDFSYSKGSNDVKKDWIRKSDSVAAFLQDHVVEACECLVAKQDFKQRYINYCRNHKLNKIAGDKGIKSTLTTHRGVVDDRRSLDGESQACWIGIDWKENHAPMPEMIEEKVE